VRWPRTREARRRLPSLGQDYDEGHRTYVSQVGPAGVRWLHTKPFAAPPTFELAMCLRTFSHIVEQLQLGPRAQVLDVGCGPGWLSEYLARCGYAVTGIDISKEMVEIARERIAAIDGPIGDGLEPVAEFLAMAVTELPWEGRFDAAILYDTLHHFDDEMETLRAIRRTLVPGGRIYIREGVIPDPGSEGEEVLLKEMRTYGTLESPFDPRYLQQAVEAAGFTNVRRFLELDALLDLSDSTRLVNTVRRYITARLGIRKPDSNTLIAMNPFPPGFALDDAALAASIEPAGVWRKTPDGRALVLTVTITNTGRSTWPTCAGFPFPPGCVTVGPYVTGPEGRRIELARTPLPSVVAPGESATVEVRVPRDDVGDATSIAVDLVSEGFHWFADVGSQPAVVEVERRS
jgi:SAM-dependent methyltransferase